MTRFLIDADEVLANFAEPAAQVISEVLGRPWTLENDRPKDTFDMFGDLSEDEYQAVFAAMHVEGWCYAIKPYPRAQAAVLRLRELCDEFFVVTAPQLGRHWVFERTLWLDKHFGFEPHEVISATAKYVCGGDFFLDDNPDHVENWQKRWPKGHAMLWTSDHNCHLKGYDHLRVNSWEEVIERVKAHG